MPREESAQKSLTALLIKTTGCRNGEAEQLRLGSAFIVGSLAELGAATRMGLSDAVDLKTRRIYRLSRNPMYVGFLLTSVSPSLYSLDPVLFALFLLVAYSQHRIIFAEEAFMGERFGAEWTRYAAAVRRYL